MLKQRLQASKRCPSAVAIGPASAHGYVLKLIKRSADHSGKAALIKANDGDEVPGVLFEIDESELPTLDKEEGVGAGYVRVDDFIVKTDDGRDRDNVKTYMATVIDPALQPYDWYKALVVAGAEQAQLPALHIAMLRALPYWQDKRVDRQSRQDAVEVLRLAGIGDFATYLIQGDAERRGRIV